MLFPRLTSFFSSSPRGVTCAFGICACIGFADSVVLPFFALWAEHATHVVPALIGVLWGCYAGGELLATPFLGGIADRIGRRPVLIASLLGVGVGFVILTFCHNAFTAAFVLVGIGLFESVLHPTVFTVIADSLDGADLRRAYALAGTFASLGRIVGPAAGALLVGLSLGAIFLAAGLALLAGAVFVIGILPETRPAADAFDVEDDDPGLTGLAPVFRDTRLASILARLLCIEICGGWVPVVLPLLAHDNGLLSAAGIGWLFMYGATLAAVLQWRTARVMANMRSAALVRVSSIALACAFGLVLFVPTVVGMIVAVSLLSINGVLLDPLVPSVVNDLAPAPQRATYMAAISVANDMEDTIGPAIGTAIFGLAPALPWLIGIPLALGAGLSLAKQMTRHQL